MAIEKKFLKIENATIGYEKNIIFENLNISFELNKINAILGKSGCGKSTLLRVLAGLLELKKGQVYFDDQIIKKPNKDICMMHQKYINFSWLNCFQNVIIGKHDCEDYGQLKSLKNINDIQQTKAFKILQKVGIEDYIFKYPYELSGGMNQRLALARVIYRNPKVILMDEPLSALDPKTRTDMQDLLIDLHYKSNNTIIMVTHDPDEAKKMCHNIIQL